MNDLDRQKAQKMLQGAASQLREAAQIVFDASEILGTPIDMINCIEVHDTPSTNCTDFNCLASYQGVRFLRAGVEVDPDSEAFDCSSAYTIELPWEDCEGNRAEGVIIPLTVIEFPANTPSFQNGTSSPGLNTYLWTPPSVTTNSVVTFQFGKGADTCQLQLILKPCNADKLAGDIPTKAVSNFKDTLLDTLTGAAQAAGVIGGYSQTPVTISDQNSFLTAVSQGNAYICFPENSTLSFNLASIVNIGSNVTIDGRGADVTIAGSEMILANSRENLIIHNVKMAGQAGGSFRVTTGGRRYWINHVTFTQPNSTGTAVSVYNNNSGTGLGDATFSWNRFEAMDKAMILGTDIASLSQALIGEKFTLHHNYSAAVQRSPYMRWADFDVFNNVVSSFRWEGLRAGHKSKVCASNNHITLGSWPSTDASAGIRSISDDTGTNADAGEVWSNGNSFNNGASQSGPNIMTGSVGKPLFAYTCPIEPADAALVSKVTANAGWQQV